MPQIPKEIIDQIAAANDIVDVIGAYFPLKRMGALYKAVCPFHQERTPSFTVNQQRQFFKCFGCGAKGSVFRFVMDYEHIDFIAAVRKLAEKANIQIVEASMKPEDYARLDMRKRLLSFHAEVADSFHIQLMRSPAAAHARDYLKERGLNADVAKSWKIGYAPEGWDFIRNLAYAKGYRDEEIIASGLVSTKVGEDGNPHAEARNPSSFYDRFRDRIMFPICNAQSEVIAFSGRILDADKSPAKYVNSPETMLFTKGKVLFGLHKSMRALINQKAAIVCEGQVDLITVFESGVQNVIASQGTAFTAEQAKIIRRYVSEGGEVILCFDSDAAGVKGAERSLPHLLGENLIVKIATMPPDEDPDSLIRKKGPEAFLAVVNGSREFFDFQIERQAALPNFNTPAGKSAAARKLAEFIPSISDNVLREAVIQNTATRLEISPDDIKTLLKRATQSRREENQPVVQAETIQLDPTLKWLLFLALRDAASRIWLQSRGWNSVLEDDPAGKNLLMQVLEAELDTESVSSISAFISTLDSAEENALVTLLDQPLPSDPMIIAEDCWHELERRNLLSEQKALKSKQHNAALSFEEQTALFARISDVQKQLADLPPPHPPKVELR